MEESTIKALGESLAANNEWVSSGILVLVHESIDPSSEATEVYIASTIGLPRLNNGLAFDISSEVTNLYDPYLAVPCNPLRAIRVVPQVY
jgi:hypothetical protein